MPQRSVQHYVVNLGRSGCGVPAPLEGANFTEYFFSREGGEIRWCGGFFPLLLHFFLKPCKVSCTNCKSLSELFSLIFLLGPECSGKMLHGYPVKVGEIFSLGVSPFCIKGENSAFYFDLVWRRNRKTTVKSIKLLPYVSGNMQFSSQVQSQVGLRQFAFKNAAMTFLL